MTPSGAFATCSGVAILCAALCASKGAATPAAPSVVVGLDHVPIAVNDLERAADDYRALGFSLKPGRPHDDGIRNVHAKFPDGAELELITAPEAERALGPLALRSSIRQGRVSIFLPPAVAHGLWLEFREVH